MIKKIFNLNKIRKIIKKNQEKFWEAAELGHLNELEALLDKAQNPYPLDLNSKCLDGWTALHFAANEGYFQIVDLLLQHDINKEAPTNMGRRALHIATIRGNLEVVKLLIMAKSEINCQDNDRFTPLHYAAENGHEQILTFLLQEKPDLNLKNYQGMLAYDLCLDLKIRNLFEENGYVNDHEEYRYGRITYGDSIRSNSRADHVAKFIFLGNQNRKK